MNCCRSNLFSASKFHLLILLLGCSMIVAFLVLKKYEQQGRPTIRAYDKPSIEWTSSSSIQLDQEPSSEVPSSQPLLPEDHPDWLAQPDSVESDVHRISIGTELASSIEECRSKLDVALLDGVRRYIDEHLSDNGVSASKLTELNAAWIRQHLMKSNIEYEATLTRPAGTYHQLWVQLEIDSQSRKTMEQWRKRSEIRWRAAAVGLVVGGCVMCLSALNVGLRFFSKKL